MQWLLLDRILDQLIKKKKKGHKRLNWSKWRQMNMTCSLHTNTAPLCNFLNLIITAQRRKKVPLF